MLKRLSCLLMALVLMITPLAAINVSASVASDAAQGVVMVYSEFYSTTGTMYAIGTGSAFGVAYEKGSTSVSIGEETDLFITNRHCVTDENDDGTYKIADKVYIVYTDDALSYTHYKKVSTGGEYYVTNAVESRLVLCTVVAYSEEYDCAILKADSKVEGRVAIELAEEAAASTAGDTVYVIGYPAVSMEAFDYTDWTYDSDEGVYYEIQEKKGSIASQTVTTGTISRIGVSTLMYNQNVISTDARISSGNSGGPMVSQDGLVIGINTYGVNATEEDYTTTYYAIDIAYAWELAEDNGYTLNIKASSVNVGLIVGLVIALVVIVALVVVIVMITGKGKKGVKSGSKGASSVDSGKTTKPDSGFPEGPRVQCTSGELMGKRYPITGVLRIGRDPSCNEVVLPKGAEGVSGRHCQLAIVDGQIVLTDLGSTYGTYVSGGPKLSAGQSVTLNIGDSFYLGSRKEVFEIVRKGGAK